MIPLGLSRSEQAAFHRALVADHRVIRPRVALCSLTHAPVRDLTAHMVQGTVTIDVESEITRSLALTLHDPDGRLGLDSGSVTEVRSVSNRMVSALWSIWVDELDRWVTVPVFCGPVTKVDREDDTLTLEGQGKERLAMRQGWRVRTWAKRASRHSVIRSVLAEVAGETRFRWPSGWKGRIGEPVSMSRMMRPWPLAQKLARASRAQLFYDGRGAATLRKTPTRPVWRFTRDQQVTNPRVSWDGLTEVNTIVVTGAAPKGKKEPVTATATLPDWHPASPTQLDRGGRGGRMVEEISDDTLTSTTAAENAAQRRLAEIMLSDTTIEAEVIGIPHLEELDPIRVDLDGGDTAVARLRRYSFDLTTGQATLGWDRRQSWRLRARRMKERRW